MKCLLCGQGTGEIQDACEKCQKDRDEGHYFFILISDKSEPDKINRLGKTFVISEEEVKKSLDIDELQGERVVFIRENEAKFLGLLEEGDEKQNEDTT